MPWAWTWLHTSASAMRSGASCPREASCPTDEWQRRHRALTQLLVVTAAMIAAYSALQGYALWHIGLDVGAVVVAGALAVRTEAGRRVRSLACSFGLLTAAAMGVHVSGGVTEAHFSFFVVVVLLTLYEDWLVFVLAVLYTLVHHGVLGMFLPEEVFASHTGRRGSGPRSTRCSSRGRSGRGRGVAPQRGRPPPHARDPGRAARRRRRPTASPASPTAAG